MCVCVCVSVCVLGEGGCRTVCRLQTSWSTILSICTSTKSLVDAVSNHTVKCSRFCRVGFYWQPGICKCFMTGLYGFLLWTSPFLLV
jgi:hypothetical protein